VKLAAGRFAARLVAIGDRALLAGFPEVEHVPLARPAVPGKLDPANSRYVLAVLERALAGCLSGEYQAMVTAPASPLPGIPSSSPGRLTPSTWS
jgi:4-hydroxy-L-threonine phosphate dehydrogenase PdxA